MIKMILEVENMANKGRTSMAQEMVAVSRRRCYDRECFREFVGTRHTPCPKCRSKCTVSCDDGDLLVSNMCREVPIITASIEEKRRTDR